MKFIPLLIVLAAPCFGSGINTKIIDPKLVTEIDVSKNLTTTLVFPSQFTGVYGTGLATGKDQKNKSVEVTCSTKQPVMVLHAITDIGTRMTVMMDGKPYVFSLVVSDSPDEAVTLQTGEVAPGGAPSREVSEEEVIANRPKYDDTTLKEIANRIRQAPLCSTVQTQFYEGYKHKEFKDGLVSDDGTIKTVVTSIHQLPEFDVIVLEGYIQNNSDKPLTFDASHVGVAIGKVQYPVTLLDCQRPIKSRANAGFLAEIVGDSNGSIASFSIENEFRLIVNTGYHIKGK